MNIKFYLDDTDNTQLRTEDRDALNTYQTHTLPLISLDSINFNCDINANNIMQRCYVVNEDSKCVFLSVPEIILAIYFPVEDSILFLLNDKTMSLSFPTIRFNNKIETSNLKELINTHELNLLLDENNVVDVDESDGKLKVKYVTTMQNIKILNLNIRKTFDKHILDDTAEFRSEFLYKSNKADEKYTLLKSERAPDTVKYDPTGIITNIKCVLLISTVSSKRTELPGKYRLIERGVLCGMKIIGDDQIEYMKRMGMPHTPEMINDPDLIPEPYVFNVKHSPYVSILKKLLIEIYNAKHEDHI